MSMSKQSFAKKFEVRCGNGTIPLFAVVFCMKEIC